MRFDVITLFPDLIETATNVSILKRARQSGAVTIITHDLRSYAPDERGTVDDTPYGGGAGMVLRVDVLHRALQAVTTQPELLDIPTEKRRVILLSPQGDTFTQPKARSLAELEQVTLICGHYEGFDERIRGYGDEQISIGDYVLTGGELPALVCIDAVTRLLPSVIHADAPDEESFSLQDESGRPLLEYPHYTRPAEYEGQGVPDVLLSGNHAAIRAWRLEQATKRTHRA
jgi:tRNA (guanine37-N1)-methyltransferase